MRMFKHLGIFLSMLFAVSFLTACDSSGGDSDSVDAAPQAGVTAPPPTCPAPAVMTEGGECVCPADVDECFIPGCAVANHTEWSGIFTSLPETMSIACANGSRPDDMKITLNGTDITNKFDLNTTGAVILGDELSELAKNADNIVAVTPAGANASVTFTYDKLPPRVVITSVEIVNDASRKLSVEGDMLLVKGLAHDVSDVTSVSINGVEVDLAEDETFSVEIDNTDKYVVEAADANEQTSSLTYATHTTELDSSLAIQLNRTMMDFILPMVTDVLADFSLPVDPKVKALTFKGGLCTSGGGCAATFTKLNMGASDTADPAIDVEFKPLTNGAEGFMVDVNLFIPKMETGFKSYESKNWAAFKGLTYWSKIWYQYPIIDVADVVIRDSVIVIKMKMLLDEESGEYKMVLDNDWMKFDMGSMRINEMGLACDYESKPWPGGEACMLRAGGHDFAIKAINDFMGSPLLDINGKIDQMLNGTSQFLGVFAQLGNQIEKIAMEDQLPGTLSFDLDKDGEADTEIKDIITISELSANASGNALMSFGTYFFVEEEALKEGYQGALGSVYNEVVVPAMPSDIDGAESDLGIAVSANMINQVMLNMYQTGILDSIEIPMTPANLCDFADALTIFDIGPDHKLRIRMALGAVPYMLLEDADNAAGINVQLDNVIIYMDFKGPDDEDFDVMMAFVTDITVALEIGLNPDNSIKIDLGNAVAMSISEVIKEGLIFSDEFAAFGSIMTPGLIESSMGTVIACMMPAAEEGEEGEDDVPTLELDLGEIAASDDDIKAIFDKLFPMDIGMIFRQFAVDNNDSYLMIAIDLEKLTEDQPETGDMGGEPASLVLRLSNDMVEEVVEEPAE